MPELKETKLFSISNSKEDSELNSRIAGALGKGSFSTSLFAKSESNLKSSAPLVAKETTSNANSKQIALIPIQQISANPFQTREFDDDESLQGLAKSIQQKGLIQPIIVRESANENGTRLYELVAGERRLRAAKLLGLSEIPVIIQDLADLDALEISIIENAQRENLNPIEEALAFKLLQDKFKLSQAAISEVIGKNRSTISNALRLLNLASEALDYLKSGGLSAGHGRALLQIQDEKLQARLARRAVESELSVRALENLVARVLEGASVEAEEDSVEKLQLQRLSSRVASYLDLNSVSLKADPQGRKRLSLTFETEASWKRFISKIR